MLVYLAVVFIYLDFLIGFLGFVNARYYGVDPRWNGRHKRHSIMIATVIKMINLYVVWTMQLDAAF